MQFTAGLLSLLGLILAYFVSMSFIIVPLFISLGLVYSGVTGWCAMVQALKYMPWNKI